MRLFNIAIFLLLLSGCGTIFSSQSELHSEVKEVRSLENVNITYEKKSFFDTNMYCMELMGIPKIVFPLGYMIFACAEFPSDEELIEGEQPWCKIVYAYDWTIEHELKHCEGYND